MALNITLAGTIYNSSDIAIDANLQFFTYNKNNGLNKWSDLFVTENTQYNKNLGDPDISGQDNTLGVTDSLNEFVVIAVWINGSRDDISNIPGEFAYIIKELEGDELYIQDIKLGIPGAITCSNWTITDSVIVGESIIAQSSNTNETTYEAFSTTHFLYREYKNQIFSETIFPFMGPGLVEYDFGNGYDQSNVFISITGGDLEVNIQVQDYFGNSNICTKTVKIYYDIQLCFNSSPSNLHAGENLVITSCISGSTDKITSISYNISGTNLNGTNVQKVIDSFGLVPVTQYVTFFNGYENISRELSRNIVMENIPPIVDLEVISSPEDNNVPQTFEFAHNGTDIDGYIEYVEWEVWRNNPDSFGHENWSLYYTTGKLNSLDNWFYNFDNIIGDLKVASIVYDNLNASARDEYHINIECIGGGSASFTFFSNFDWSKKVKIINFNIKKVEKDFSLDIIKDTFKQNIVRIDWTNKPKKLLWKKRTKKMTFRYSLLDV